MKLLQRVMTLIRANINDLIDKAEDPEKMIKQLIMDLNNQLIQVKTSVAQSIADQHMLEKKLETARQEVEASDRQARLAVEKGEDQLAREGLQRFNSWTRTVEETDQQLTEQRMETDALKAALNQLQSKIDEVTRQQDVLLARHRRANNREKMTVVKNEVHSEKLEELLNAITRYVDRAEAKASAAVELQSELANSRLSRLEEDHHLEKQLAELKAGQVNVVA